jgi:cytochrome c-type biogenesis protein
MSMQIGLAFAAGLLSFLSPCTLPLYPAYLSRLTGLSYSDIQGSGSLTRNRILILSHTAAFILGLSVIYIALGYSAALVGQWFVDFRSWIRIGSGILFVLMGMMLVGLFPVTWLTKDRRWLKSNHGSASYAGSFLLGLGFAAGWTPCIGPMLSSIISLAATEPERGLLYMVVYILGFSIPFFLLGFFLTLFKHIQRYSTIIMKSGGSMLMVIGLLLLTDKLSTISAYLNNIFNFTGLL